MSRTAATGRVIPVRLPLDQQTALDRHLSATGKSQTDAMREAIALLLSAGEHVKFTLPPPTSEQMAGMRDRALSALLPGVPLLPVEIGRRIGCSESAAGAYCRDLRKGKYGGHNVVSIPAVVEGRRVSYYRLEGKS